jgi:hypothetical protein
MEQKNQPARESVTLIKGRHRWVFSWLPGEEPDLLNALQELAENKDGGFEWFDAAIVARQLSERLGAGIHRFVDGRPSGRRRTRN